MSRSFLAAPLVLALLVGCAMPAPQQSVTLPPDAMQGFTDPTRAAILGSANAFAHPAQLAGNPAAATVALVQLEFLAAELPGIGLYRSFNPVIAQQLRDGRAEARTALGISAAAPPQQVVDGLMAAGRAVSRADRAAAEAALAPFAADPALTLNRLGALPPLPRTAFATSQAGNTARGDGGRS